MSYQILFSGKNKKNIISVSSVDLAKRVVMVIAIFKISSLGSACISPLQVTLHKNMVGHFDLLEPGVFAISQGHCHVLASTSSISDKHGSSVVSTLASRAKGTGIDPRRVQTHFPLCHLQE